MFKKKLSSYEQEVINRLDVIVEAHRDMVSLTAQMCDFYKKMWGDQDIVVFEHKMPRREAERLGFCKSAISTSKQEVQGKGPIPRD